jgi:hypothetical protein
VNTSCFACKGGKCVALAPAPCRYKRPRPCPFFKTQARIDREQRWICEQHAAKPAERQRYIADKYYDGTMPWMEG